MFIITVTLLRSVSGESVMALLQAIHFRATPSPDWNNPGALKECHG